MILAEKIIKLRKKNGWSQEDLAFKLDISRQSVSKWESASSLPDLDKIIKMSELFGVSTDYLLKDDAEEEESFTSSDGDVQSSFKGNDAETTKIKTRSVSLEEANSYLALVKDSSWKMALAVAMCIMSPIILILLAGLAESGKTNITSDIAGGIGVCVLLIIIACAVSIFIKLGMKLEKYSYLEKEALDLQYGIAGIAEKKKADFEPTFKKFISCGVAICILSVTPLIAAASLDADDFTIICFVALLLFMVALAVFMFIFAGMINSSFEKLLETGEFTREKKSEMNNNDNLAKIYWCLMTAIYLASSFITNRWDATWIIWPCAGVLYGAVLGIAAIRRKNKF